jgi:hypothetical protein
MKIRIKGNSVRIRISKSELNEFAQSGVLQEETDFGLQKFSYKLIARDQESPLDANYTGKAIEIYVNQHEAQNWANTELVGIKHYKPLANDNSLFLLLEKDFKCIDNEAMEDQSDNFDNPLHTCQ